MRARAAEGMLFWCAVAALLIVMPLALLCLIKGRRKRASIILSAAAFVLGLVAVFGDTYVFNYIVASRGYVMDP
jgi:hypothetical protein